MSHIDLTRKRGPIKRPPVGIGWWRRQPAAQTKTLTDNLNRRVRLRGYQRQVVCFVKLLFDSNHLRSCDVVNEGLGSCFWVSGIVCWLFPDAIGVFLFHALQVSPRESTVIGALFFAGAAILLFIESPDDKRL